MESQQRMKYSSKNGNSSLLYHHWKVAPLCDNHLASETSPHTGLYGLEEHGVSQLAQWNKGQKLSWWKALVAVVDRWIAFMLDAIPSFRRALSGSYFMLLLISLHLVRRVCARRGSTYPFVTPMSLSSTRSRRCRCCSSRWTTDDGSSDRRARNADSTSVWRNCSYYNATGFYVGG